MNKFIKRILPLILIGIVLVGIVFASVNIFSSNSQSQYTQIVAFGDSYSDNGGAKRTSTAIVNSENAPEAAYIKPSDELYWNDRYSNGKTAVEVLADHLELPLTNYAVGGAKTDETNYSAWMDHLGGTGLLGQIKQFEATLENGQADPNALYFIFASANDYFQFQDYELEGNVTDLALQAVENIKTAVETLAGLGAKNFFVVNSSDVTLCPDEIRQNRTEEGTTFVNTINTTLPATLEEVEKALNLELTLFDVTKVSDAIVSDPAKYGITNLDAPAQPTWPEVLPQVEDPTGYYFWDEWHYTATVHEIIGTAMAEAIN